MSIGETGCYPNHDFTENSEIAKKVAHFSEISVAYGARETLNCSVLPSFALWNERSTDHIEYNERVLVHMTPLLFFLGRHLKVVA